MVKHTFEWSPSATQPNEVFLAGSFDEWNSRYKLDRDDSSVPYKITMDLPCQKIYYKFIVDGTWLTSTGDKEEVDSSGINNNVVYPEEILSSDDDGVSEYTSISYPTSCDDTGAMQHKISSICDNLIQVNEEDLSSSVQITIKDDNSVITKNESHGPGISTPRLDRNKGSSAQQNSTTPITSASTRGFLSKLRTLFAT
ncbi:hypothetical protein FOA43_004132 [Brettanomyces nanus]|uniref:AMP-activated protein kinase glycogen-binding domain-containing protein n=1 Tax=Eeniella nana TaxID=13502 RepID=A0A875S712_EENNA|nr:uncharacterized protein FOA43_004132 [Brettanomyces nanus]QPG76738.1 hypothetical protein FOA43_004132 [Brettanomyces nanus]